MNMSPMKQDLDVSMFSSNSPMRTGNSPYQPHTRRPLEEHDPNSQDSGYSASVQSEENFSSRFQRGPLSFGSMESMDDEFLDISELIGNEDENARLPGEFSKLISEPICSGGKKSSPEFNFSRPAYRRVVSMVAENTTPNSRRVRSCLFKATAKSPNSRAFKRPDPCTFDLSPLVTKRTKVFEENQQEELVVSTVKTTFKKSMSTDCTFSKVTDVSSEDRIMSAVQRSLNNPDLIGDFTKAYCLPLTNGRHQDLKSIAPRTLYQMMQGDFIDRIGSFKVIDCRYPYEFQGGHIEGALNLYTREQILEELLNPEAKEAMPAKDTDGTKRNVLVFHCEFSSERGPNLSRFLRNVDRIHNKDTYPYLHYPEVYLLDGGYKKFYEQFSLLCSPKSYMPMLHPNHSNDLRLFRAKAKTWNNDCKMKTNKSTSFRKL